ncbi:MAG: response regulator [Pseudomonadota bacterium]
MDEKTKILIVDDDIETINLLKLQLGNQNYAVQEALNGETAIKMARTFSPDIILLDLTMPNMNGFEVCEFLRKGFETSQIIIIMLTGNSDIESLRKGVLAGADDYITKPYSATELIARINMAFLRKQHSIDVNPTTLLPGNNLIHKTLQTKFTQKNKFALCYADIDNFKSYNDKYGYDKGNEIIKKVGALILASVKEFGTSDDFIGHIGGDDFIIISSMKHYENICRYLIKAFDEFIIKCYNSNDRRLGYIIGLDRSGNENKFPLMTLSIGITDGYRKGLKSYYEIIDSANDMKKYAKGFTGSVYKLNLRKT